MVKDWGPVAPTTITMVETDIEFIYLAHAKRGECMRHKNDSAQENKGQRRYLDHLPLAFARPPEG